MLKEISITNYKLFKEFCISGLARVNILTGRSGAGKTSLLEAIKISQSPSPQTAMQISQSRGFPVVFFPNSSASSFESIWSNMFFGLDVSKQIEISWESSFQKGNLGKSAKTTIKFEGPALNFPLNTFPAQAGLIADTVQQLLNVASMRPLIFDTVGENGIRFQARAIMNANGGLQIDNLAETGARSDMYPFASVNPQQMASLYSELSVKNETEQIDRIFLEIFDMVDGISLESPIPGMASLFLSLKGARKKIPLPMVSSGMNKIFNLMLLAYTNKGGILLIDEIENGIYHRNYEYLWGVLDKISLENQTQIFVTTHSNECFVASKRIVNKSPEDFSVIQLYLDSDGIGRADVKPAELVVGSAENGVDTI